MSEETLSQEAQDPQTLPYRLIALANQRDAALEPLLAKNPNLPKELLFSLGARYPLAFLENPASRLMLLESDSAQPIMLALAALDETPYDVLKAMLALSPGAQRQAGRADHPPKHPRGLI